MDPYMDDPYDPYPPPRDMYDRYSLPLRRDYLSPPPHPFMPGDYPIPPRKRRERLVTCSLFIKDTIGPTL